MTTSYLPNSKPAKSALPCPIGSLVELKTCPGVGRVTGWRHGKVLVRWDSNCIGKHKPDSLVLIEGISVKQNYITLTKTK